MGLGAQIRKYRLQVGWTLERLSEASGVEIGTINALEKRDSNRSKYFPALAKALGLSIEQLADEAQSYDLMVIRPDGSTTVIEIKEPAANPYGWPFKEVSRLQWQLLTDEQKQHVERTAIMMIKAREDPKHQAPAKNIASA